MSYYDKYLKYKEKYTLLKGGKHLDSVEITQLYNDITSVPSDVKQILRDCFIAYDLEFYKPNN